MARQPENVNDGMYSALGGVNSNISPSLLADNQVSFAVNATNRGGFWRSRPKFRKITLDFNGNDDAANWFYSNPISGQYYYSPSSGSTPLLVCCAGGRFFAFQLSGNTASIFEFTPSDGRNSQFQSHTWFCQAANFLVAQNGLDLPVIFDGATGRRSNIKDNEVPTGRQMAYINNRLFVVAPNGRQIYPGDLAYSTPTSAITFTEILDPATAGGQPLGIPIELGGIKGLIATAQQDTAAGQGTLLVATDKALCSINAIVQRSQWPNTSLQNVAMIGNGFVTDGLCVVNGDVWGRSVDGYRSYIMARREFGQWGNTPQSAEMNRVLVFDDKAELEYSSCVYFDNRLLMTVNPTPLNNGQGAYHNGIIALNFDNISTINEKSTPSYDGLWTGIHPYGFCSGDIEGKQRCFSFCKFDSGNELYEITTEYGDDNDTQRIESFIETRSFTFKSPFKLKQLEDVEIYADEISGEVNFNLMYRPNQYPCWTDYKSWSECAAKADCSTMGSIDGICHPLTFQEIQYRPRMVLGKPQFATDPVLKSSLSIAYEFGLRLQWTGQARIRGILLAGSERDVNTQLVR